MNGWSRLDSRSLTAGGRGFLLGCFFGGFLTMAGSAIALSEEQRSEFAQSLLYAIAELAVDSEKNAIGIVKLRQRVDDLELRMQELDPAQD